MRKTIREFICWHNWRIIKNAILEVTDPKQNALIGDKKRQWAYPKEYRYCLNCGREVIRF